MTKDLEVRHCRALLAVAETGGVSAAARALGVAQSTVSETLLSLERLLGAPVTVRSPGRGAVLSAAGQALIPHARAVVGASEEALASIVPKRKFELRLGAVESIGSFLLPEPLRAFRAEWPEIDLRIAIGLCEDLRGRVGRGELDAALTIEGDTQPREGPGGATLSSTRLCFVVAGGHPMSRGIVAHRDLVGKSILLTDAEGAFHELLHSWLGPSARSPWLESAGSVDGVKRGILNSDALGVLPEYAVAKELEVGSLVMVRLQELPPPIALRLATRSAVPTGSPLEDLVGRIRKSIPAAKSAVS